MRSLECVGIYGRIEIIFGLGPSVFPVGERQWHEDGLRYHILH